MSGRSRGLLRLLVIPLLTGLAACADAASSLPAPRTTVGTSPEVTEPPLTTTTVPVVPQAPVFPPYAALPEEPEAAAKRQAANLIQALATYDLGAGTPTRAQQIVEAFGADPSVATAAELLLAADQASGGEIVYPQIGGLTADAASVMVVFRQHMARWGGTQSVVRTADVRLRRVGDGWTVTALASLGDAAAPPAAPVSEAAAAVLANPRLDLPDTARWDVLAGRVDERVLTLLQAASAEHRLSIVTLASGHPVNVFGTERISNHTRGRAVDIWAIDGIPVVSQRDTPPAAAMAVLTVAVASGVDELGAPWVLEVPGSFSDTVHQDHLHLGFRGA